MRKFYHGLHAHHPFCSAWRNMHGRCHSPTNSAYAMYGAKGITVCASWYDFTQYYLDMFPTWQKGLLLDRRDNALGYSKDNCRWATPKESAQSRNTSKLTAEKAAEIRAAKNKTRKQLAAEYGVSYQVIQGVLTGAYW